MKLTTRILPIIIALINSATLFAEQVNLTAAREKAMEFVSNKLGDSQWEKKFTTRSNAEEFQTAYSCDAFHVFNVGSENGYVIVSGDDRMPTVLGYSYSGSYDADNLPKNMEAWLQGYKEQYEYVKTHPDVIAQTRSTVDGDPISPMLETSWHQHEPYNNLCPDGLPAGCVVVAMAQIMYYHKWPKQTTEVIPSYESKSHEYVYKIPEIGITTIDWDNMLPSYTSSASERQKDAVATLMKICGSAVQETYNPIGSGASDNGAMIAFGKYFDYPNCSLISRYELEDCWNDIIYDELKNGRPVYYSGSKEGGGGHAFVVDGYDGKDYFHVNWGWGNSDGFYLLTDLEGFNSYQEAIIGINPPGSDSPAPYGVFSKGVLTLYYDSYMNARNGKYLSKIKDYGSEIISIEIDPSFSNYTPFSIDYFSDLNNLKSITGLNYLNTQYVTNMTDMFKDCSNLTSLDLSGFKTDRVRNMLRMFRGCSNLTSLNLSNFNTSRVTNMGATFARCSNLTSLDLSNFNTSCVTNMTDMFAACSNLTSLDLSGFKTDNVTGMTRMFQNCSSLTSLDLSNFNTSRVYEMCSMFADCSNLTSLDVSSFNTNNVVLMSGMFQNCSSLTSLDLSNFNTSRVDDMGFMFANCSNLTSLDVSSFNTNNVVLMSGMFFGCQNLTSLDLSGFKTDNVTDMDHMFSYCSNLSSLDISGFKTEKVVCMSSMFAHCKNLTSLDLSGFKTDSVTNMTRMFQGCSSLTSLDVSAFKTDKVEDMNRMFQSCSGLTSLDLSNFNTFRVYDMGFMFNDCLNLRTIYVGDKWSTKNVQEGDRMFYDCRKLAGSFGTRCDSNHEDYTYAHIDEGASNPGYFTRTGSKPYIVKDPYALLSDDNTVLTFYYDEYEDPRNSLSVVPFKRPSGRGWNNYKEDITKVVFDASFANCTSLTSTANWFYGFTNLKEIVGLNNVKTDSVTSMSRMFQGCSSLTSLDVSAFKTDNVISMDYLFYGCSALKRIFVGELWSVEKVEAGWYMFLECGNLIGGKGTKYNSNRTDLPYAHIDGGVNDPGFFSDIKDKDFVDMKYHLIYMVDGKEYKSYEIEYGASITPEKSPAKEGYTFSGWSEVPKTMPAKDVTVTGSFTINKYKLTYTVDGKEYKTSEVEYGASITPEAAPTKEGYTFSGWSDIPKTMPAKGVTVTGTFTINKYKLTYTVDGLEYKTSEVEFGASITAEAVPTKEGYTFSGWSEIPTTMPAKDVTVTGSFVVNKYKLIYMVDGEEYKTYEVEYGSSITVEADPTKEGYVFSGWSEMPSTMPAKDVTVTGTFIQTAIGAIRADGDSLRIYDLNGNRLDRTKNGVNIIRQADGKVRKVVVK